MKRTAAIILTGIAVFGAAIAGAARLGAGSVYTDGDTIRVPAAAAPLRDILWQPALPLTGAVRTEADEYEPALSADGMALYFVRGRAGHNADLYTCTLTPEGWSTPEPLGTVNSGSDDLGPRPSADGRVLYFYSDRPGGQGGYDLWAAPRGETGWEEPVNLGAAVNTPLNEYGPAPTPDGKGLYFASNRPRPGDPGRDLESWPATVREQRGRTDYDLYLSALDNGPPAAPMPVAALNTGHNEGCPAVSPFGDFLYFASDRPGGTGGFDLYRTRRLRGNHLPPENLGDAINSHANDLDPALSMGGYALHFSTNLPPLPPTPPFPPFPPTTSPTPLTPAEPSSTADGGLARTYDLYHSTSREVFRESEPMLAGLDWSDLLPLLWWLLLSLLLLLLLLSAPRASRSARFRRLSLLAKCLLLSLLLHLLILLCLTLWQVGVGLERYLSKPAGGVIAVTLPSTGDEIAQQLRAAASNAPIPPPATLEVERHATPLPHTERQPLTPRDHAAEPIAIDLAAAPTPVVREAPPSRPSPTTAASQPLPSSVPITIALPSPPTARGDAEPTFTGPAPDAAPLPVVPRPSTPALAGATIEHPHPAQPPAPSTSAMLPPVTTIASAPADAAAPVATSASDLPVPVSLAVPIAAATPPAPPSATAAAEEPSIEAALAAAAPPAPALTPMTLPGRAAGDAPLAAPLPPITIASHDAAAAPAPMPTDASTPPPPASRASLDPPLAGLPTLAVIPEAQLPTPRSSPSIEADSTSPLPLPSSTRLAARPTLPALPGAAGDLPALDQLAAAPPSPASLPTPTTPAGPAAEAPAPPVIAAAQRSPTDAAGVPDLDLNVALPALPTPAADAYSQRSPDVRAALVERLGGSDATELAVERALAWLARHQGPDGSWSSARFDDGCGRCDGASNIKSDVALTGLALLCFLGADHTHTKSGPYQEAVGRALRWLLARQSDTGDLRDGETMYSQGIAAIALSEALGMTGDEALRAPVERATRFIVDARRGRAGGWRYDPGQPGDTSVLGWMVMAMASAQRCGVEVPRPAFDAAGEWLRRVSWPQRPGVYAYQPGLPFTPSMTAEGLFVSQLLGRGRDDAAAAGSIAYLGEHLPDWERDASTYYWYYATLALFHHQGPEWERWNAALTRELLAHQRADGEAAGSWDPKDRYSVVGGRVYQTAICTLSLEVYYRYLPMYGAAGDAE